MYIYIRKILFFLVNNTFYNILKNSKSKLKVKLDTLLLLYSTPFTERFTIIFQD